MEKLVSGWFNDRPIPKDYVFPPETRPGKHNVPFDKSIPVIDLSEVEEGGRAHIIQKILKGSEEFGFFQVINHGVSENLMNETMSVLKEFFHMPAEYKQKLYSDDPTKLCRLFTSSVVYASEKVHLWRDTLKHPCHPLQQWLQIWPENPPTYRECVGAFSVEVQKLGSIILRLISEGLGLKCDHFDDKSSGCMTLTVNHYPPCPDPSLTMGAHKHADPNLLTILLQDADGLQVFKDGKWIGVEPLPNAFVVNIGYQLQIISNDKFKSAEHRVVTNSSHARTTAVFFISPSDDSIIEPAKAITDEMHPPIFKPFVYKDFLSHFVAKNGDTEAVLASFKA